MVAPALCALGFPQGVQRVGRLRVQDERNCRWLSSSLEGVAKLMTESKLKRATLTVEETAVVIGCSRTVAYQAVASGEIYSIKVGRRIYVPRAALERMLNGTAEGGAMETPLREVG